MSPGPAANSGTDNLGNYLILPFFTAWWAYFLEYQMRPAAKIKLKQEREPSASISVSSAVPPPASLAATRLEASDHRPCSGHKGQSRGHRGLQEKVCCEGSGDQGKGGDPRILTCSHNRVFPGAADCSLTNSILIWPG